MSRENVKEHQRPRKGDRVKAYSRKGKENTNKGSDTTSAKSSDEYKGIPDEAQSTDPSGQAGADPIKIYNETTAKKEKAKKSSKTANVVLTVGDFFSVIDNPIMKKVRGSKQAKKAGEAYESYDSAKGGET